MDHVSKIKCRERRQGFRLRRWSVGATIAVVTVAVAHAATNTVDVGAGPGAELIQNRDFDAGTNSLPGWSVIAEGGAQAEISLCADSPLNEANPHSLRLSVTKHQSRAGVTNCGFGGMKVVAGDWYDLTFYARTETNKHFGLIVSLESQDGQKVCSRATLPEVGGDWKQYTLALQARESDPRARLVIAMPEAGTIWFDVVSLSPRNAAQIRRP
jgi:alpha-L-arabinofuranosidase